MIRSVCFFTMGFAVVAGALVAQEPLRAPDGGTSFHVAGVELLPIQGVPLTGKSSVEWTRSLEDGSAITVQEQANLARDSQGRLYREKRSFVPVNSGQESRLRELQFFDPVAGTQTICSVERKTCIVSNYFPRRSFVAMRPGPFANGTRYLGREDLGTNVIDGLDVIGTRETTTIDAGVVGNDKPLVSTREFWYSAQLKTNLMVTRIDPREGKQVVRLIEFSQSEPDPHTFDIPAGYTIDDARAPVRAER